MLAWGYDMIKQDKNGKYVDVRGNRFYIDNIDETVDDMLSLINSLRQAEKIARKYEECDDELFEVIRRKIAYYSIVLSEIYGD